MQGMDEGATDAAIEATTVGIYVLKDTPDAQPEDIGIVLEGNKVLEDLDSVGLAVAMLFGLFYAMNIDYPSDLKYTFEVVQSVLMDLEGG